MCGAMGFKAACFFCWHLSPHKMCLPSLFLFLFHHHLCDPLPANLQVLKLKGQYDELHDQLEAANKENKHLQGNPFVPFDCLQIKTTVCLYAYTPGEISDLEKQLSEGGSSVHDLEKAKRKLEQEKEELTQSLEDAEGQLEGEQQRVLRIQLELTQLKQETERKLAEKDGEMESLR